MLTTGDRVWVNVPKVGYVAIGRVTAEARRLDEFVIDDEGRTLLDVPTQGDYGAAELREGDTAMILVGVEWSKSVGLDDAVREVGFFGNQNTVARPLAARWRHTVERLSTIWGVAAHSGRSTKADSKL